MFGSSKDKRAAATDPREAANAALRAVVERLEALPMARLAAEVMVKGFGPGGPGFAQREPYAASAVSVSRIAHMFQPQDARHADLYRRLSQVVGEGLQVLEHQSLIWAPTVSENFGIMYAATRRGRAALEANAVEQALRGAGGEPA
jgi:hypothetical protein